MGSHAGIVGLNRLSSAPDTVARLRAGLARGAGPTLAWAGVSGYVFNRPLVRSTIPASLPNGRHGVVVAFDGLVDGKSALARELDLPTNVGDCELLAEGYARWGTKVLSRLHLEWSIAIYDSRANAVLLASDFSGARPLYYSANDGQLLWSVELPALVRATRRHVVRSEYIIDFIVDCPPFGTTPFEGIAAVPPGACLTFTREHILREPISSIAVSTIRYQDDREYEQQFRHLLFQAVGDRMHDAVTGSELSGGLDTSSIVCVASDPSRGAAVSRLMTFFYRFEGGNSQEDEVAVKAVAAHCGCELTVVDAMSSGIVSLDLPEHSALPTAVGTITSRLAPMMRQLGIRTLLSGEGGDTVMWEGRWLPCVPLIESLQTFKFAQFLQDLYRFSRWTRRTVWDMAWHDVVNARKWRRRRLQFEVPAWIGSGHVASFWARAHETDDPIAWDQLPLGAALLLRHLHAVRRRTAVQPHRLSGQIDLSYPFLDTRLVGFMLSIPWRQKIRPGETRSLQRRALKGILPEQVRSRTRKVHGTGSLIRATDLQWNRITRLLADGSELDAMGVVSLPSIREAAARARMGLHQHVGQFWRALAAEVWLRGLKNADVLL